MRVVIADDSEVVRRRLADMLSGLTGVQVVALAKDGEEALHAIVSLKPDAVVLDIRMPKKNGMELLKDIRVLNNAPVKVVLTNYPSPVYRKECMRLGADYFFDKSTQFDDLMSLFVFLTES